MPSAVGVHALGGACRAGRARCAARIDCRAWCGGTGAVWRGLPVSARMRWTFCAGVGARTAHVGCNRRGLSGRVLCGVQVLSGRGRCADAVRMECGRGAGFCAGRGVFGGCSGRSVRGCGDGPTVRGECVPGLLWRVLGRSGTFCAGMECGTVRGRKTAGRGCSAVI